MEEPKNNTLAFYIDHVNAYEREAKSWESRGKKIVKRYRDDRGENALKLSKFNILWSNIQTLHPALYDGPPTPNVDRRFDDDEEVNTTVSRVLEKAVSFFVKTNDFDDCMNQAVLDRLLPGRGQLWVRYVPNFKDIQVSDTPEESREGVQVTDDVVMGDEATQELHSEDVVLDYVHWRDFGHDVCRTWQENRMVWRRVYLSKREIKERFPDTCMANGSFAVPMDSKPLGKSDDKIDAPTKATIYELWDKVTKKVYWFHKEMSDFLDQMDDPLNLSGFYPCPKPLFATTANDSLIPTPDFVLYQDQANELDIITGRIDALTKALKVVGVYDASAEGVQRMLSENVDNKLIPVTQWAVFAEKGGLKGAVDYFPVEMVGNVLLGLYDARTKIKQDIYEITGISDIVRGATNANETATAQKIKGQFATLRLDNMQKEVARFSRDCVKIMTEIIAEHFSIETIKEVCGIRLMSEQEKMMASQQKQMGVPLPDKINELLTKPTWEQIEGVLRQGGARNFRIDIETDSTIKADQEAEKASRVEFLTAAGGFIQQAAQVPVPELQPLLMRMLEFGVDGFKAGRELQGEFKVALDKLKAASEAPKALPPDPLMMEKEKLAMQERVEAAKLQSSEKIEAFKIEADVKKERLKAKAEAHPLTAMNDVEMLVDQSPLDGLAAQMQAMAQSVSMLAGNQQAILEALNKPKRVNIARDMSGKMIAAEVN